MTTRILAWDWKEQPDFDELRKILTELSHGQIHVAEPDTRSDQFALVFSTEEITQADADEAYRRRWDGEDS